MTEYNLYADGRYWKVQWMDAGDMGWSEQEFASEEQARKFIRARQWKDKRTWKLVEKNVGVASQEGDN